MRLRSGFSAALTLALAASSALAQAPAPRPPPGISVAQPAGDVCPPGGRNFADTFAPAPSFPNQTRAPRTTSKGYKVDALASGLVRPRSLAFLPDGRMLVAEGREHLRIVDKAGKISAPLLGMPTIAAGQQTGLMDVALDRGFSVNRTFYLGYAMPKPGAVAAANQAVPLVGRVVRARLTAADDGVVELKTIYEGAVPRRLLSQPDGSLLFTTTGGDATTSQSVSEDAGKLLRIMPDGTTPKDNPFASRADAHAAVYAIGVRDPEGLAVDRAGGVWEVEHGLRGGDELNRILPGKNYGFPLATYGREESGAPINNGATAGPGLEQPVYYWTPAIAPSGLMVYSGAMFPAWKGNVFLGGMVAMSLVRLEIKGGKVAGEEFLLAQRCKRIRDVRQGPDGAIYLLTDYDNGELLRISKG